MIQKKEWQHILKESSSLNKPLLVPSFFDYSVVGHKEIKCLIQNLVDDPNKDKIGSIRAYSGGRSDFYEDRVVYTKPFDHESILDWCKRVFENKQFGLIINRAEKWNEKITEKISPFNNLLSSHFQNKGLTIETVVFIGDYGYSPFGAHQDGDNCYIFHFHLGPGLKEMILWSEDNFESCTGSNRRTFNPESFKDRGEIYNYKSGDFFFLPGNYYHVGNAKEFSIMLAVVVKIEDEKAYLNEILKNGLEESLNSIDGKIDGTDKSFIQWLSVARQNFNSKRKSNLYFLSPSVEMSGEPNEIQDMNIIRLKGIFFIEYTLHQELNVYTRGHHIKLFPIDGIDYFSLIINAISIINTGNSITYEELKATAGFNSSSDKILDSFLSKLVDLRGITVS